MHGAWLQFRPLSGKSKPTAPSGKSSLPGSSRPADPWAIFFGNVHSQPATSGAASSTDGYQACPFVDSCLRDQCYTPTADFESARYASAQDVPTLYVADATASAQLPTQDGSQWLLGGVEFKGPSGAVPGGSETSGEEVSSDPGFGLARHPDPSTLPSVTFSEEVTTKQFWWDEDGLLHI